MSSKQIQGSFEKQLRGYKQAEGGGQHKVVTCRTYVVVTCLVTCISNMHVTHNMQSMPPCLSLLKNKILGCIKTITLKLCREERLVHWNPQTLPIFVHLERAKRRACDVDKTRARSKLTSRHDGTPCQLHLLNGRSGGQ